jgi:hypothetical protein
MFHRAVEAVIAQFVCRGVAAVAGSLTDVNRARIAVVAMDRRCENATASIAELFAVAGVPIRAVSLRVRREGTSRWNLATIGGAGIAVVAVEADTSPIGPGLPAFGSSTNLDAFVATLGGPGLVAQAVLSGRALAASGTAPIRTTLLSRTIRNAAHLFLAGLGIRVGIDLATDLQDGHTPLVVSCSLVAQLLVVGRRT